MSTDRQQDAGLDRLLREALRQDAPMRGEECPEADVVAAYAEGGLTAQERNEIEPHMAGCSRCQSTLGVMARDMMATADSKPARVSAWRAWISVPRIRWLAPAGAAVVALILYVAVKPESTIEEAPSPAAAATPVQAPEGTMAKRSELGRSPASAESPIQSPVFTGRPQAGRTRSADANVPGASDRLAARRDDEVPPAVASPGRSMTMSVKGATQPTDASAEPTLAFAAPAPPFPAATAAVPAPSQAAAAPTTPALEKSRVAEAVMPSDALGASARGTVANRSAVVQAEARAQRDTAGGAAPAPRKGPVTGKRLVTVEGDQWAPEYDAESLWNAAEFVVRGRAVAQHPAVLVRQRVAPDVEAVEPIVSTDFVVVEVFKRANRLQPAPQFVLGQTGSEAEDETTVYRVPDGNWVRIAIGSDYVLFLTRSRHPAMRNAMASVAGPLGIFRLDGDLVLIGNGSEPVTPPSTSDLLARLRLLAGTARR